LHKSSGYKYHACGSSNLKTYSYATCDVTVMHDESRLGRNELNIKINPKPNLNPNHSIIVLSIIVTLT